MSKLSTGGRLAASAAGSLVLTPASEQKVPYQSAMWTYLCVCM